MKKRIVVAVVLAVLFAASAYTQATDFFEVVKTGTPQSVQDAIYKGANIKAKDGLGRTPLMLAAQYNKNPEVFTTLLSAGADPNARDMYDCTCLIYAGGNNLEVISILLRVGAAPNAQDVDAMTPLMSAAQHTSNPEVISALLGWRRPQWS